MDGRRLTADATGARALPSGLVTFLLSDVVGSTRMWERAPEAMPDALVRHEQLIADAVERRGGVLLKSKGEGDSTFSVFESAPDAALAALDAQRSLRTADWPAECRIAVRMAIHTGEAVERERDYFGRTVNRVARLRGIADGGEVLLTLATAERLAGSLPQGARLVELGLQQLRDLDHPERVFALADDVVAARPRAQHPLRSLPLPARLRSNLGRPFVGRSRELSRLEDAWAHACDGDPRIVIVDGEAGIGKSRLVSEVAAGVHGQGGIVLVGHCDDVSAAPFQPFAEMFRFVTERVPLEELAGLSEGELRSLRRLGPAWSAGTVASAADADAERQRLLVAACAWFRALAAEAPLLVVVEDLHWATATTFEMLHAILRDLADDRVLVIASCRSTGRSAKPVRTLLEDARRSSLGFDRIDVTGLTLTETSELIALADAEVATKLAAEVHAFTSGNPLFVLAVASTAPDSATVSGIELPESVHALLDRQLDQLDDQSRAFLVAAAVLGASFEVDLAADLCGASFDVVEQALDEGERHLVIHEQSAGALHVYAFNHALVASALTSQLTSIRRRRLHADAAKLLSSAVLVEGERDTRVARHAEQAASAMPPGEAIAAFRHAAHRARDRMAFAEAIHWLGLARGRASSLGDERTRLEVDIDLGATSFTAGSAEARAALLDTADAALAIDDPALAARALGAGDAPGASEYLRVDLRRTQLLETTLSALPSEDRANRAQLLVILANELTYANDREGRRFELADEALAIAREHGDPIVLEAVLAHRLSLYMGPALAEQRLAEIEEMMQLLDARAVPMSHRFAAIGAQSMAYEQLGRVAEGRALLETMLAMEDAGELLPRERLILLLFTAGWQILFGRLAEAESTVREAHRLVQTTGDPALAVATARGMLAVRFWQDRVDTMLGLVGQRASGNPMLVAHQAYWLLQAERVDESAQVWSEWDDTGLDALLLVSGAGEQSVMEGAAVCAAFDTRARCVRYYELIEPLADRLLNPFAPDQPTHHYLGLLARAMGDDELAAEHFASSLTFAERVEAPLMAGRASLELARQLERLARDHDRAVALVRAAIDTGHARDARWLVRTGAELLDGMGAT